MENRYWSAKADLRYLSWYAKNFFSFKGRGAIFIACWVSGLVPRVLFGPRGKNAIKKLYRQAVAKKRRAMPVLINGKTHTIILRDLDDFDLFHEICIRDFYGTADLLKTGMTVVDVGANIGTFSILSGIEVGNGGRVIAFELEADNFSMLEKNVAANGLRNTILKQVAIGDYDGAGKMYISPSHEGHSLLRNNSHQGCELRNSLFHMNTENAKEPQWSADFKFFEQDPSNTQKKVTC